MEERLSVSAAKEVRKLKSGNNKLVSRSTVKKDPANVNSHNPRDHFTAI